MSTKVGYAYETIIHLAVIIDMVLTKEEREELVARLLREAAQAPEDSTNLFLQSSINYIRSISDV